MDGLLAGGAGGHLRAVLLGTRTMPPGVYSPVFNPIFADSACVPSEISVGLLYLTQRPPITR